MGLMVMSDGIGLSLNYGASRGPKNYEITSGDRHKKTNTRSKGEWQFPTFAHLVFEPVDNLAAYGYRHLLDGDGTKYVGYALHAIGDAAAPHHVGGSPGWGHRPYEDAMEERWLNVRWVRKPDLSDLDVSEATVLTTDIAPGSQRFILQKQYALEILQRALEYRQVILQWRIDHPNGTSIPLRDLITMEAKAANDYVNQKQAAVEWPFNDWASIQYNVADEKVEAIKHYTSNPDNETLARPLFREAVALPQPISRPSLPIPTKRRPRLPTPRR